MRPRGRQNLGAPMGFIEAGASDFFVPRGYVGMGRAAYGSLTTGLDLQAGQTLLVRGGTSALGLATTALAKDLGAAVIDAGR